MAQDEHPVWKSLDALLDDHEGEDVAMKYVNDSELSPLEFLSACAAQGPLILSWKKRVEVLKAARIAIAKDSKRAFGFGETLFRDLLNAPPYEEEGAALLVEVLLDINRIVDVKFATQSLLKCLYDPILTRISNVETAQRLGKRIIDLLENEVGTFTVQKILLYQSFREREELQEGDSDSEESLSAWANTSDSTESSLGERDFGCPVESSAAAAWVLAPNLIDPPVLAPYGRFAWTVKHIRFLLTLPSNTMAAQRGFELFACLGSISFPSKPVKDFDFIEEAYDVVVAALKFASAEHSLVCRDAIASFISEIDPAKLRCSITSRLAKDTTLSPPLRGWALDLLRKEVLREPDVIAASAVKLVLAILEDGEGLDDQIGPPCFSLLLLVGYKQATDKVLKDIVSSNKLRVVELLSRIHRKALELESEVGKGDRFELRHATPRIDAGEEKKTTLEAPQGYFSDQANFGRARLVAGLVEPVLALYKSF